MINNIIQKASDELIAGVAGGNSLQLLKTAFCKCFFSYPRYFINSDIDKFKNLIDFSKFEAFYTSYNGEDLEEDEMNFDEESGRFFRGSQELTSYYFSEELQCIFSINKFCLQLFTNNKELFENIVGNIQKQKKDLTKKANIYFVCEGEYGLYLENFNIPNEDIDLNINYGEGFQTISDVILDRLNTRENGIALFHGMPGTGKTHYIRYLISKLKKKVILVPPNLVPSVSSPNFIPFIKNHAKNSVLVIEDAEELVVSREGTNNLGISNLLNVSDGILGDAFKMNIICTFNTPKEEIDTALLRKGRLIAEHHFGKLSSSCAQKLVDKLKIKHIVKEDMTLAEIYNLQDEEIKAQEEKRVIGFGG